MDKSITNGVCGCVLNQEAPSGSQQSLLYHSQRTMHVVAIVLQWVDRQD
jgi:hypothetical protein